MKEEEFFKIIETTKAHTPRGNDIAFDESLIHSLVQKTNREIAQFHLQFLKLRRSLDIFEINKAARKLDLYSSRVVYERFCNGIIASGEEFYNRSKDEKKFLIKKKEMDSLEVNHLYYEGLDLVSSTAFYEKNGLKADWDGLLRNEKRLMEIQSISGEDQELER